MDKFSGRGFLHVDFSEDIRYLQVRTDTSETALKITLKNTDSPLRAMVTDPANNPLDFACRVSVAERTVLVTVFGPRYILNVEGEGVFRSGNVLAPKPVRKDDDDDRRERVLA